MHIPPTPRGLRPRWALPVLPAVLACCLVVVLGASPTPGEARPDDSAFRKSVTPLLRQYCLGCHAGKKPKGDLDLGKLTADVGHNGRAWKAVLERLGDRSMPPRGKPQPPAAEVRAVTDWVASGLKAHQDRRGGGQGRALLRRLNRVEYNNTVRDLLGVDVRLVDLLPEDGKAFGFDNVDVGLDLSATLLERYLDAAEAALDAALAHGPRPPLFKKKFFPGAMSKALIARGRGPLFVDAQTRDDCIVYVKDPPSAPQVLLDARVPRAGRYRFRILASSVRDPRQTVSMRVHAGYGRSGRNWLAGVFDVSDKPAVIEFTERLAYGDGINMRVNGVTRAYNVPPNWTGPGLAVYWVEVEGPAVGGWPPPSFTRLFGRTDPDRGTLADAETILRAFVPRAYRRPVSDAELKPLLELVRTRLGQGRRFHEALRVALTAVLCSPSFLYLEMTPGRLNDFQLASRLSYFLWGTMPDATLFDLAKRGKLNTAGAVRAQVERMLNDPKARAFSEDFTGQWLNLRNIKATNPDPKLYPEFDPLLEFSLPLETYYFFEEILKKDRSLLEFVDSDWTMLNGRLAEHYGLGGVQKVYFRKARLPAGSHRGGVLTQAGVLKVTANGTGTSPVVRGVFLLDRILGKPAPPPPRDVPAVEPDIRGAVTIREQLARHRSSPACASCHERIDPPGFALESFDVIGGWRTHYRVTPSRRYVPRKKYDGHVVAFADGPAVECAGRTADGKAFDGIDAFKKLLLADKDQIARALARRLLVYATGHGIEPGDDETVEKIVAAVRAKHYGFRSLIHEVVQSKAFRSK
jgi:hypothetical protein